MSNREANGLRGPVRICVEEQVFADRNVTRTIEYDREGRTIRISDGNAGESGCSETSTVYDGNGRLIQWSWKSDGGSFNETLNEYDGTGKLMKSTHRGQQPDFKDGKWVQPAQPKPDKVYIHSYDEQERLVQIANTSDKEDLVVYRYDAGDRKTSIRTFGENRVPPGHACAGSAIDCMGSGFWVPEGGKVEIIFNDDDQPLEAYVYDKDGSSVCRAMRTYDDLGRFATERSFFESGELLFPSEVRAEWAKAGVTVEQVRAQFTQAMGGNEMQTIRYRYDQKNRLIEEERTMMGIYQRHERVFDDDGELTEFREMGRHKANEETTESYYDAGYSYEFDEHGNWIVRREKNRHDPDEEFKGSAILKRELRYF